MIWIRFGTIALFLAVAFGAFGAHALKARLSESALNAFEIGVRYQFYHGLALLFLGLWPKAHAMGPRISGWCFVLGILLFSGSLYVLALSGIRWVGIITPMGGLAFLVGWLLLIWSAFTLA